MKRMLGLLLLGSALGLSAQEGQSWATAEIGGAFRSNNNAIKNGMAYGLGGGHWLDDWWGLDLKALGAKQELRNNSRSGEEKLGLGSLLLNLRPGADNWYPYLSAGIGATRLEQPLLAEASTKFNYHLGVGLLGHLSEHLALQVDLKFVRVNVADYHDTDALLLAGLGYTWGGGKKAAPARPMAIPTPAPVPNPVPPPKVEPPPPPPPAPAPEAPKAAPVAPPPPPAPAAPPPPAKIVLNEAVLHFANGKNVLSAQGIEAIRKVAESLKPFRGTYMLVVSGHTSALGKASFNKALSKRRADAVVKILVDSGIPNASIRTEGVGPNRPLADNKSKEGQARNRRVEIEVMTLGNKVETRKIETPTN